MKLSFKIFCISYIIVLLSSGIGGIVLIEYITNILWDTQVERVNASVNYAVESILSLTETTYGEITEDNKNNIIDQIKGILDSSVKSINIYDASNMEDEYKDLDNYQNRMSYTVKDNSIIMNSLAKIKTANREYLVELKSDFSGIQKQNNIIWNVYTVVILTISVVSGIILFIISTKIAKPINYLSKVADDIALGNYGKTVDIIGNDYEIINLTNSFNSMSKIIEQKIKDVEEEVNKRDLFVADFTHELKTPMTAIIGYSQMLNSYDLEFEERKEASKAIYNEAKRLEKLSLQLLDLYIYKNDNINFEDINLLDIQNNLKGTLIFLAKKYNIEYNINFSNEIIRGNRELLISLMYNLIDNAFKASVNNTEVKVYCKTDSNSVEIFVEDSGIGINNENIRLITEPFYREDKARSRKLGGAGLGLSLCNEIAKLHNTKLIFKSEKGKGTTVSFKLKKSGGNNE